MTSNLLALILLSISNLALRSALNQIFFTLAASAKTCASRTSAQVWGGLQLLPSLSLPSISLASIIWRLRRVSEGLTLDYG
ncbi:hypothetical protein YC2023_029345 [Brassica napus]